jgi:hypothetical protein
MEIGSIGSQTVAPQALQAPRSEAAERVPDSEAGEGASAPKANTLAQLSPDKAPLPSYSGTVIDTQA